MAPQEVLRTDASPRGRLCGAENRAGHLLGPHNRLRWGILMPIRLRKGLRSLHLIYPTFPFYFLYVGLKNSLSSALINAHRSNGPRFT